MSDKKVKKLVNKAMKLKGKQKLQDALIIIDEALKLQTDYWEALSIKGQNTS